MKSEISSVNDYFPLCFDIGLYNENFSDDPTTLKFSAEELVELAWGNHLTELQTLTLFIKNAFEGHLFHLYRMPVKNLIENGTTQIDLERDYACTELTCDFFNSLHLYMDGIDIAWKLVIDKNPSFIGTDVQSMLYFILTYQLFRLPVSYLINFKGDELSKLFSRQRSHLRLQYFLYYTAMSHAAQRSFIDLVNDKYAEKFKDVILKLSSKETILLQLFIKLEYANDPSIKNEEELEKKYFEFLIANSVASFENREPKLYPELKEDSETHDFKELLKTQLKKLYKTISKNCSEVHNQLDGYQKFHQLSDYFIAASAVYNAFYSDLSSLMLQHSRLILLLAKVINIRVHNHLPVEFIDFTGIFQSQQAELKEEDMILCQTSLQRNLDLLRTNQITDYKVKYLKDDELSKIHREFLLRQLDYIENRILEVIDEIKVVMLNKANNVA